MLFTTAGDVWDLCSRCAGRASTTGCAFCLNGIPKSEDRIRRAAVAAISLYSGATVVDVCDACFPYELDSDGGGNDGDDNDDQDDRRALGHCGEC
jgi:hypothetical protein